MITGGVQGRITITIAIRQVGLQPVGNGENVRFCPRIIEIGCDFEAGTDVADNENCQYELPHSGQILLKPAAKCNRAFAVFQDFALRSRLIS